LGGAVDTFIYNVGHLAMHLGWACLYFWSFGVGPILHEDMIICQKRQNMWARGRKDPTQ